MAKSPNGSSLWPSSQLLLTADGPPADGAVLNPQSQLRLLSDLGTLIGPETFAEALVYSTPRGNTGWTAFRMGKVGHVTYHHWDVAKPTLLQLDLFGIGTIDDQRALSAVEQFWAPIGSRIVLASRPDPIEKFGHDVLHDDLTRRSGMQVGLGPGDHLHLLVDQTGPARRRSLRSAGLSQSLLRLVERLKMRCMTPVLHQDRVEDDGMAYDAIVGITTSHVSLRIRRCADRVDLSLDVFSCRKFDTATVLLWLDALLPTPSCRRSVLYNRHPRHEFTLIGD